MTTESKTPTGQHIKPGARQFRNEQVAHMVRERMIRLGRVYTLVLERRLPNGQVVYVVY